MCINRNSYEELLSQDDRLTLDANDALTVELDANGQPLRVNPSMNAGGANASNRFFSRFDDVNDMHYEYLSDAEKRLIAEWLDVGAQYYNNPFDVPIN